jgi:hypothetical protein
MGRFEMDDYDLVICDCDDICEMVNDLAEVLKNHGLILEQHDIGSSQIVLSVSKKSVETSRVVSDLEL